MTTSKAAGASLKLPFGAEKAEADDLDYFISRLDRLRCKKPFCLFYLNLCSRVASRFGSTSEEMAESLAAHGADPKTARDMANLLEMALQGRVCCRTQIEGWKAPSIDKMMHCLESLCHRIASDPFWSTGIFLTGMATALRFMEDMTPEEALFADVAIWLTGEADQPDYSLWRSE